MEWKIDYLEQEGVIQITTSGRISLAPLLSAAAEALALAETLGVDRFLADHRNSTPDMETLDIYNLPQALFGLGLSSKHRIATLLSEGPKGLEDYQFFEDVAFVNKIAHKLFADYEAAICWLQTER